ncbi:MAG: acyl-CoA thioesterase [Flavobacteriales bacterium]|nr:acyl-CoA thioesterase [Flavobacteriales bacterium]MCX7650769.1 acyl-CoA thioesterase [Flavobacteriales bacterium]MDW8431295.1 acyl-CoA thioesterase [Flavobacteriales bacterium]
MGGEKLWVPLQVRYVDCDMMGHVNNAVFLSYFELGRVAYGRRYLGDFLDWKRNGFLVARHEVDYTMPLLLTAPEPGVEVWCSRVGRSSFDFSYVLREAAGSPVYARGRTVAVYMNLTHGASEALPPDLRQHLERLIPKD